jgi:tRNA modification GTPase
MAFEKVDLPHPDDTIVAQCSALGGGVRAIVRLSGPRSHAIVQKVFRALPDYDDTSQVRQWRITPGCLCLPGFRLPIPAWVYRFYAPRSYTGQDMAELHTLGSPPLIEQLVAYLLSCGARAARPGEFTLRAFLAGKKDLSQAEAVRAVIEAEQLHDLQHALAQLAGGLKQPLQQLREQLLDLLADMEANLDFVDQDISFLSSEEAGQRIATCWHRLRDIQRQMRAQESVGRLPRIVLVGPPNAGKSSLFNALSGADALVSPIPGTTRDYLVRCCLLEGQNVELVDTAGWQPTDTDIDAQAQQLGRQIAERADILVWCDEHGMFLPPNDPRSPEHWSSAVVLRVRTKADLPAPTTILTESSPSYDVACSVTTNNGLEALRHLLADKLQALSSSPLAPSRSRCQHHLKEAGQCLQEAIEQIQRGVPLEFVTAAIRAALHELGELTGAIYTPELLDRIFSRFCIGK